MPMIPALNFLTGISILCVVSCSVLTNEEPDSNDKPVQQRADSTLVMVKSENEDLLSFLFMDMYGNQYELTKGENKVPVNIFISEGYSDTFFPVLSSEPVVFIRNKKGVWVATDTTGRENADMNFFSWCRSSLEKDNPLLLNTFDYTAKFMNPDVLKAPERIDKLLSADIENEKNILAEYHREFQLDDRYLTIWEHFIENRLLSNALLGMAGRPETFSGNYLKKFTENLIREKLGNDNLIIIPEYKRSAYFALKILEFFEKRTNESPGKTKYDLVNENFSGATKDILLTKIVMEHDHSDKNEILSRYYQDCKNAEFISYVKGGLSPVSETGKENLISISGEVTNLSKLLSEDEINYVDFWASWCAPCRAEMPASKALKRKFEGKGVNFIYLSIDKDLAAWKKASAYISLEKSYVINKASESDIVKQFSIGEIPRYIIFNKKGEVIQLNAPRPGSPEIEELLNKLLMSNQ